LAVLHPAGGAGVLPLHAGGLGALLQESGFVHDQHAVVGGEVFGDIGAQVITHSVGVPPVLVEQPLHPVRGAVTDRFRDRPTVLARHRRQQPQQVSAGTSTRLNPSELRCNPRHHVIQTRYPPGSLIDRHKRDSLHRTITNHVNHIDEPAWTASHQR
jgi:hypothetical protein